MAIHLIQQAATRLDAEAQHSISVLVMSEIRFLREGLADALDRHPLLSIVGLCADLNDGLDLLSNVAPNIVLLDATFPNGANAVRCILMAAPEAKVVVFAVTETEENIIAWAEAGAAGYIPRTAALRDLVRLLFAILQGEQICSRRVASALMRRVATARGSAHDRPDTRSAPMLTVRQQEIVGLVSAGMSNKEIARRLDIELSTAKSHVHNLLEKLNLRRRGQVAFWRRENAAHIR
jgi:DNA-binding NarL/FixJ family response regulator